MNKFINYIRWVYDQKIKLIKNTSKMIFNNSLSKWFSMGRIMLPDLNEFESEIAQVIDEVKYLKEYIQKTSKGWTNIEKKKPQKGDFIVFKYFDLKVKFFWGTWDDEFSAATADGEWKLIKKNEYEDRNN